VQRPRAAGRHVSDEGHSEAGGSGETWRPCGPGPADDRRLLRLPPDRVGRTDEVRLPPWPRRDCRVRQPVRPPAGSPGQPCIADRAPGFKGNRLVVLASAELGAGRMARSLVVLIRSISPRPSGRCCAGPGIGAVGGADATGGRGRPTPDGGGWDVGSRMRWVVRCVGACWLGLSGRSGAGGPTAGPTPRINRGPRRGSPIVIA